MNKFAIYTAVVGNYDEIRQPLVIDSRFDYYLFSNTISEKQIGVWQVKPIEYTNSDQVKIARYVKTHPETLLPEYTATLWMDANIQIVDSWVYERFLELYAQGCRIASVKHPERDCIYDEMFTVCSFRWETFDVAWRWNRFLRKNGYPRHNGLIETNIIYRINSSKIYGFDDEWWFYIENYSRRDQLSFNYVIWKRSIEYSLFLDSQFNAFSSSSFNVQLHQKNRIKRVGDALYMQKLWNYYDAMSISEKEKFRTWWLKVLNYPLRCTMIMFCLKRQYLRLKNVVRYFINHLK